MEEYVIWALEMICVENHGVGAMEILFVSSYLAPGNIASDVLLSVITDSRSLSSAIELLKRHSLIERTGSETDFIIRKFTQSTIRKILKIVGLEKHFLFQILSKLRHQLVQVKYVDHLLSFLTHANEYQLFHKSIISARNLVLKNLVEQNRFQEAYSFSKEAFNFLRKNLGVAHPITLDFQNNITNLLGDMGKFAEAEKFLTSILKESIKSSNQTKELIIRHVLVKYLMEQCKYKEALTILETILGDENISEITHKIKLSAWNNYGFLLTEMGKVSEAYNILRDVLKRAREICDPEDDDISNTRMILAWILRKQRRYAKALEMYDEILYDRTQYLGELHFKTLKTKISSAMVFLYQKKYDQALLIYYDGINKLKRALGESHPEVLAVLVQIATENRCSKVDLNENEITGKKDNDGCIPDYENKWPLHHSAENGDVNAVKELLLRGASYCQKDCDGREPLQLTSNEEIKHLLNLAKCLFRHVRNGNNCDILEYSAVIHARDRNGYSTLHWIAYHGNQSALRQILEAGVDITHVSNKGNTALHLAVSRGHTEIVEIMLQRAKRSELKKLLNTRTRMTGSGALHVAVQMGHLEIVKCLLKYGAVYDIRNNNLETPWHLSRDSLIDKILDDIHDLFPCARDGNGDAIVKLGRKGNDEKSGNHRSS
ncbi:hypothetical protein TNIN_417121 [Trichonephila inaurata madagascariensis]|uniref:Uncharacterized protein n=1 Tax=Trichonephila inaurata madagascariensis TaxID=2747483 RepID=A0A8X6YQT2_9ARAC|nr:hypothetical protein TNIN_417121 [Trichonephila inaurata madagascariensis]